MQTLTGSEKQVAWAETVRADLLAQVDATIAKMDAANPNPDDKGRAVREQVIAARERMSRQTSAAWWLDHRSDSPQMVLKSLLS